MHRQAFRPYRCWCFSRFDAHTKSVATKPSREVAQFLEALRSRGTQQQRTADDVFATLQAHDARHADYALAAASQIGASQWVQAVQLLQMLQAASLQPGFFAESSVLAAFEKGGRWQSALAYLTGIKQHGPNVYLTATGFRAAIRICIQSDNIHEAETYFEKLLTQGKPKNLAGFNAAISACEGLQRWEAAIHLYDEMQDSYLAPDIISYNTMITVCGAASEWRWCMQLLDEMRMNWLTPDTLTRRAVQGAAAKSPSSSTVSALRKAVEGMRPSQASGVDADWSLFAEAVSGRSAFPLEGYRELLRTAAAAKQWQKVLWVLSYMEETGALAALTLPSKNLAARACLEAGQPQEALRVLQLSQLDRGGYNILIRAAAELRQWKLALEELYNMMNENLFPSEASCTRAISAVGEANHWADALQILTLTAARKELGIIPYNATLEACKRSQQSDVAVQLLCDMELAGVRTDVVSYNTALAALRMSGAWEKALHVFMSMQSHGLQADRRTWTALLGVRHEAAPCNHARKLLALMQQSSVQQDCAVVTVAIGACRGLWADALNLLQEADASRIRLDMRCYAQAVQACLAGNQWDASLELMLEMEARGFQPK